MNLIKVNMNLSYFFWQIFPSFFRSPPKSPKFNIIKNKSIFSSNFKELIKRDWLSFLGLLFEQTLKQCIDIASPLSAEFLPHESEMSQKI